ARADPRRRQERREKAAHLAGRRTPALFAGDLDRSGRLGARGRREQHDAPRQGHGAGPSHGSAFPRNARSTQAHLSARQVNGDTGYTPEHYAIELAEKAGFKVVEKSDINANPKDTKD